MLKPGLKKMLNNEQGGALVYTLLVLMVLSILGISVGMVTVGSYRLAHENQDSTSAYYIAEAGARTVVEEVEKDINKIYASSQTKAIFFSNINTYMSNQDGKTVSNFSTQSEKNARAKIKIVFHSDNESRFTIYSTGIVGKREKTVEQLVDINWIEKNNGKTLPSLQESAALVTDGGIEIGNGTLQGDIYTNSNLAKGFLVSGWPIFNNSILYHQNIIPANQLLDYPKQFGIENRMPKLKIASAKFDMSPYKSIIQKIDDDWKNKTVGTSQNLTHEKWNEAFEYTTNNDVSFNKIYVRLNNGNNFKINTNGKNITIFVNELDLQAPEIKVVGDGTITIVVKNTLNIIGTVRINSNGSRNQFNLIYLGTNSATLSSWGTSEINGNLVFTRSDLKANSTLVNGIVLVGGNLVELSGGRNGESSKMLLIAPNGKVTLSGSYSISGNVVSESFMMSGGTSLFYQRIDTAGFPFGTNNSNTGADTLDLFSTGPLVEPN